MKKLIIAVAIMFSYFSIASAELGVNVGVSAQIGTFEGNASEGSTDTGTRQTTKNQEALFGSGSFFIEKTLGFLPGPLGRLSIGYDNIAHDIKTGTASNFQNNTASASGGNGEISFNNQVSATIDGFKTVYATARITDWLYVKGGSVTVDVTTTETLASGGSYPNTSLDGTMYGIGIHQAKDNGVFFRLEYNDYTIDGVTLTNQGATSNRTVILNDLDGSTARVSIGKSF